MSQVSQEPLQARVVVAMERGMADRAPIRWWVNGRLMWERVRSLYSQSSLGGTEKAKRSLDLAWLQLAVH